MGKKPSSRPRRDERGGKRKAVDRRPGGKAVKKQTTGNKPRSRQSSGSTRSPGSPTRARPGHDARSSQPNRASTSQRPSRARQSNGPSSSSRTPRSKDPVRETRASGPDRTSTSKQPQFDEPDNQAVREERDFHDAREDGGREKVPKRAPQKGAEKDRETHWIDFATKEQKDIIHEEVNMFGEGDEPWEALVVRGDNNVFIYQKGTFISIHLMPREGKDRFKVLMGNPGLKHFGLFLGMFKGTQFNLALEGASELTKRGAVSRNWIKLSDDGEKSFLYGQDIKKPMVQEVCPRGITHNRGICIILNARGECIGMGKLEAQDPRLVRVSDDDVIIQNVVDRGVYLRNQERYA